MSIIVRSTKNCPNTTRILFGLEELDLPYTMERVEDGVFSREWGSPGPTISDGDVTTIEPGAILRHLSRRTGKLWPATLALQAETDRLFELQGRRISRAIEKQDGAEVARLLTFIDAKLLRTPYLLGDELTLVDVYYAIFAMPETRSRLPFLANMKGLSAFADRIAARPAFERAVAMAAAHLH